MVSFLAGMRYFICKKCINGIILKKRNSRQGSSRQFMAEESFRCIFLGTKARLGRCSELAQLINIYKKGWGIPKKFESSHYLLCPLIGSKPSNKPLEWAGHHLLSAPPPQSPCLPLRGSVSSLVRSRTKRATRIYGRAACFRVHF
jgi:hypothetical protein